MSQADTEADGLSKAAIGAVSRSGVRRAVLRHLRDEGNAIATDIADAIDTSRPDVSRRLIDMRELGLVELLSEDDAVNYRLYAITDAGERALEVVGRDE